MRLFYFTYCYPYGAGEQWKANELNVMVKYFDEITVIPFFFGGNYDHPKKMPGKVKLSGPLFTELGVQPKKTDFLRMLFHRKAYLFLAEFFKKKIYSSKEHFQSWVGANLDIMRLLRHPVIRDIVEKGDQQTILYYYWGRGSCEVLPFIDTAKFKKTFVRMHRFDLFEYANNNYIPYRKYLLDSVQVAAPSSQAGKEHLKQLYPHASAMIEVFRCGTIGNGKLSKPSQDNTLRVVSCSGLSAVKRVHLMIESLQFIDFPVLWRHVGGGALEKDLKDLVGKLKLQDKFIFEGNIESEKVLDFYTAHPFDLFVNTSESEGVPFSIMEAFSVGIPVMATDVGGTGEIVDEEVGSILCADVAPAQLAVSLKTFYDMPVARKEKLRENAFKRYREKCDAEKLTEELVDFLRS